MKNKNGMTKEAIVGTIIIILVLIIILWWMFGNSLINWIYNLPGYSVPKEDVEIDVSDQIDQTMNTNYKENCFEYCNNFGECKEKGELDEFSLGKMDCGTNKECYAKKNVENIKSGDLSIIDFYYTENGVKKTFLGKNEIGFIEGDTEVISSRIEFSNNFCYSLKYNGEAIIKKYSEKNTGDITAGWVVKKGFLEVVAWNPKGKEFVVKRIEIKSLGLPEGYENGKIIEDKNFKQEISTAKSNPVFYVFNLNYNWETRMGVSNYKIEIVDGKLKIYILGDFFEKEEKWFLLDCNIWGWGKEILIDKIKNSLSETLKSCEA